MKVNGSKWEEMINLIITEMQNLRYIITSQDLSEDSLKEKLSRIKKQIIQLEVEMDLSPNCKRRIGPEIVEEAERLYFNKGISGSTVMLKILREKFGEDAPRTSWTVERWIRNCKERGKARVYRV